MRSSTNAVAMRTTPSTQTHPRGVFERPKGSGVWWVCYFDQHGRRHREKVGPKALALKVYQKRKVAVVEGRFFPEHIRHREVLLADMIDDYLARATNLRAASEYERYGRYWKTALRGHTLAQIVPGDIERYIVKRLQGAAPATVNRELSFLRRVFNVAIADGKAERNPLRGVRFLKENNQRVRFLTDDEEAALRKELSADHWRFVVVALHTGLRRGEQFGLRWEHVDFANGILTVPRSKHGEVRRVPMNTLVRETLRTLPSRMKSAYVFPSKTGVTALGAVNFAERIFRLAVQRARLQNFHWHDLRHTFASRLTMAGVDLRTVQELMGHKTVTMTLRYSHLSPEHQQDAVERLTTRTPTATTTATSGGSAPGLKTEPPKVADLPAEIRAGDRGRTGDVQLGKLAFYR